MKASSTVTWRKRLPLQERLLPALRLGLVITVGLQQNTESKAFRRKLINRPLALRGQTKYIQAHGLGGIAERYLDCPEGTLPWKLRRVEFDHNAYRSIDEFFNEAWLQAQTFVLMNYTTNLI